MRFFAFCLFAFGLVPAHAETLIPAQFFGQPQVLMQDGHFASCGLRIMAVSAEDGWWVDSSVMLDRIGYATTKAVLYLPTSEDISQKRLGDAVPFRMHWFKAVGAAATQPVEGKVYDGEGKNSRMYLSDMGSAANVIASVLNGQDIYLGFKFSEGTKDFALYGKGQLEPDAASQILSCLDEVKSQLQSKTGDEPTGLAD